MNQINGEARDQLVLFTETLDEIIQEENPIRFVDAYVEKLNMRQLNFKVREANTGRPSYSEKLLLKIYIYGYMNKIRSSRKLENECKRNIEVIWLTGRLAPDFKTIADFRKDNKKGIKSVFKEFIKLCHELGLVSFELIGIDGTKMRAQNSNNNIYKRDEVSKIIERIDHKIEEYLKEMEKNDIEEKEDFKFSEAKIEERLKNLRTKKEKAEAIKKMFEEDSALEKYFANDPESGFMKDHGRSDPGYNIQAAVDNKNKLFVVIDVTKENNDMRQMKMMSDKVEEIKKELKNEINTIKVADAGYYSEPQVLDCEDTGHDIYIPYPYDESDKRKRGRKNRPAKGYQIEDFKYDKEKDVYICPQGNILTRRGRESKFKKSGKINLCYVCKDCKNCTVKINCTRDIRGRSIEVSVRQEAMDEFKRKIRSEEGKRIICLRKEICEHPFGTIKRNFGYNYFLLKGKAGALSEINLIGFVYNLKRVINICGMEKLMNYIA